MITKESCEGEASGSNGCSDLKKGPWTPQEDEILTEYVKKNGEGNWNSVQKNSGLFRCGKSCRLRWANHLRPNLKKGAFSPEEEKIIIELHAKLGNKWARMASQLPGRTDNEIKNFWNTRLKRRQRAGLPVYPQDVEKEAAKFHLEQQEQQLRPKRLNVSSSSFEPFLSPLQRQKPNCTPSLSLFDPITFSSVANPRQNQLNSAFYSKPNHQFRPYRETKNNVGYAMPLSPVSPFLASSSTLFNQNAPNHMISAPSVQFNTITFNNNVNLNPMIVGGSIEPFGLVPGFKVGLPSFQTPPQSTPTSSGTSGGEDMKGVSSNPNDYVIAPQSSWGGNTGLLDALLQEGQGISRKGKLEYKDVVGEKDKGKQMVDNLAEQNAGHVESALRFSGYATIENQLDDLSSSQSSIGMKQTEDPMDEMNSMDEDLLSLLNNFPSSMPVPEWYNESSRQSSSETGSNAGLDTRQNASPAPVATSSPVPDLNWSLGSCCWNNMPSIC